jgi:preprotein translocase subunit SecD
MLEFARWKYFLVVFVTIAALLFALPSFYQEDPALQVVRKDKVAMDNAALGTVEQLLASRAVPYKSAYIDDGRAIVRFADVADQLKARDAVNDALADQYLSALTNASRAPAILRKVGLRPMALGLDLRGGLYLLYQVDVEGAISQLLDSYEQGFRRSLAAAKISFNDIVTYKSSGSSMPNALRILLPAGADVPAALAAVKKDNSDLTFSVVSEPDGPAIEMALTQAQITARRDYAIEKNRTTLTNRVNEMGVSEPIVQRQGADKINVQLPGVSNAAAVKDLIGKVATLEFRMEDTQNNAAEAAARGRPPLGSKLYLKTMSGLPVLLKRELVITGDQLTNATATTTNSGPAVAIKLNGPGGDAMLRNTEQNVGKRMGVVYIEKTRQTTMVDGKPVTKDLTEERVINLATIQGVFSNTFDITGLQAGESSDLSKLLRAGSLSAPITLIEEQAIGPSLGQDNIVKGRNALLIGLLAIFIFMVLYYHAFGLVANAVLLANVLLLTALLAILHASLSLPGIAGIILTVGIAVDANVLIYERIREELRNGVTPQAAIRAGFEKAFSAILDSNVTAFLAGFVLYVVGTGPVQSFAIVLLLGILTSMFTSLLGSRALITLMYGGSRKITKLSIG